MKANRLTLLVSATTLMLAAATAARADVTISSDATANMSCSGGVCQPTASDAVLNVTDLETLLAAGSVTVTTTGSGVQANNIDLTAKLGWNADALLAGHYKPYAPPLTGQYFNQRKTTIYAGSTEIQKNLISQMILGL